jgi:hypothetical protein
LTRPSYAIARATALALDWAATEALTDEQLELKLYGASAYRDDPIS